MASGDAEHKARQRARNGTRSGSSGITSRAVRIGKVDIDELENLQHVADVMGLFESGRIYSNGAMSGTMQVSPDWAHDLLEISQEARGRALVLRAYVVPLGDVLDEEDED